MLRPVVIPRRAARGNGQGGYIDKTSSGTAGLWPFLLTAWGGYLSRLRDGPEVAQSSTGAHLNPEEADVLNGCERLMSLGREFEVPVVASKARGAPGSPIISSSQTGEVQVAINADRDIIVPGQRSR